MSTARRQKPKESKGQAGPSGVERLKTVVRRLPPNLPEAVFWQSVQAWVTNDSITWKSYYPGKFRTKRTNKEGIPSRAYIAFKNEEQVAQFSREYDGHVFRDKAGNESYAIVEFAPFQKIPTDKKKSDARNNTIDQDDDYTSFLESLKGKTESVSLEALIAASQSPPAPTTTPLLEALKAEKLAQKDKETILRSHAHYKDVPSVSKKEEARRKAVAAAQVQAQATKVADAPTVAQVPTPAPLSKKARKAAAATTVTAPVAVPPGKTHDGQPTAKHPPSGPPLAAKSPTPGHGRHRAKEHRVAKIEASTLPAPLAVAAEPAPTPTAGPASQRKTRPVVGLGRHFEAALNGAVAVSPSPSAPMDRKKRDKSGEVSVADKGKHRESAVPSILQRPDEIMIMPRAEVGSGPGDATVAPGAVPGVPPVPPAVRGARRGRGRARGGRGG